MTIIVPDIILNHESLTSSEKLLYPQLVVFCGESGTTNADNPQLAEYLKISERTASAFITNLHRAELIDLDIDRKKKANQRTIKLKELTQVFAPSPILAQKYLTVDAEFCVKFAQIIASTIPDAKFRVMLSQILASTNETQNTDNQSKNIPDAESCVNLGEVSQDSVYNSNSLLNELNINSDIKDSLDNTVSTISSLPENRESEPPKETLIPSIHVGLTRITPDELGPYLKIRGIAYDKIAPFVGENNNRSYNDLDELRNLVRAWYLKQKPKAPKATLEERKAAFENRIKDYRQKHSVPAYYTDEFFELFLKYWLETNLNNTILRFEGEKYFELGQRLKSSYERFFKPMKLKQERNAPNKQQSTNSKERSTGHVDFSRFATGNSEEAANDERSIDDGDAEVIE
ncbi:helix-turn-helix domain-containing protein [Tellurirhabdus bombi]|uniref:helix-turn-helix domain-containing protein n=1 Tax=Tellurirhabdus bombi TaxID=2907205 RepID=UPI001F47A280|nr:helix-turn-helix domain-containing protein [Tellurirhabdus bombi]